MQRAARNPRSPRRFHPTLHRSGRIRPVRLFVEALDDRTLPSNFTVTTTANDGEGSFRQAILDSNATLGIDTINFNIGDGGMQTIQPTAALPEVTDPVLKIGRAHV